MQPRDETSNYDHGRHPAGPAEAHQSPPNEYQHSRPHQSPFPAQIHGHLRTKKPQAAYLVEHTHTHAHSHSPSISGDQPAHQQGTDHPTNSKDGHGEGIQDSDQVLIWSPAVVINKCFVVEFFDVLMKQKQQQCNAKEKKNPNAN